MSQLEMASPAPIYLQLERILKERIRAGLLKPGSKLPSELELASHFKVSRSTIRKVLDRLSMEGLIQKWPGKGSYVSVQRLRMAPNSLSFSAQMIAAGHSVTTRVLVRQILPIPEQVAQALERPLDSRVIRFRRLRMLDGVPAAIHGTYLPYPDYAKIEADDLREQSLSHAMEWATGVRVVSSRGVLSVVQADPEDATLLNIPAHSPVVLLKGVGQSEAGVPVRFTEAVYRSDRFEFAVSNTMATTGSPVGHLSATGPKPWVER